MCVCGRFTAFAKQDYASVGNSGLFCKPAEVATSSGILNYKSFGFQSQITDYIGHK